MWAWLKRLNKVPEQAARQAEIIGTARRLMGLMENWQVFAGKTSEEIGTVLMNIGLGHVQAIYEARLRQQQFLQSRKAQLN